MKHRILFRYIAVALIGIITMPYDVSARDKSASFTKSSFSFIENKGQVHDQHGTIRGDVDYMLRGNGANMFIAAGKIQYQWLKPEDNSNTEKVNNNPISQTYRLDVSLVGANSRATATAMDMQQYTEKYYGPAYGQDGIEVHSYKKIVYKDIYPHIDWVVYLTQGKEQHVKYDFVVNPGGNAADIKIKYNGHQAIALQAGALVVKTPFGDVKEEAPISYYAESKQKIESSYKLTDNVLSFAVEKGNEAGAYIIDPAIAWSTYFGATDVEAAFSVVADTGGNTYVAGVTTSSSGLVTTGAFQTTYNGNRDAFLAKFDNDGVPQWCTYYGGTGNDNFFYVTADTSGGVYVSGITTTSSGMSTTGSHQSTFGGGSSDAYLVKFSSNGTRLWATYFGGGGNESTTSSYDDYMVSVTWDKPTNSVYLCGMTNSTSNISTTGAYQTSNAGGNDGYLAKFTPAGVLQWSTYFGGADEDKIVKVSTDHSGNIYATGITNSTSGIATSGTHQTSLAGGKDVFIAKFNTSGALVWGTYYGGTDDDGSIGIATDNADDVYVAGSTFSTSGIATSGAFQVLMGSIGPSDAYLTKFSPAGTRIWGTYFGGSAPDITADIDIDANNNVCFSGTTGSIGLASPGAYQSSFGGNSDAFIAVFGPGGSRTWVSYLGGTDADNCFGIAYSKTGDLFITGNTSSISGISTPGSFQMLPAGTQDAYLCKFKSDTSAYVSAVSPLNICAGDTLTVSYAITNPFNTSNVFSVQLSDPFGNFATYTTLGSVTSAAPGTMKLKIPNNTPPGTLYRIRMAYTSPAGVGYSNLSNITIKLLPDTPTITHNSPICTGNTFAFTAFSSTPGVSYTWQGPNMWTSTSATEVFVNVGTNASGKYIVTASLNGCIAKDSFTAVVDSTPVVPVISGGGNFCTGSTIAMSTYSATNGVTYKWTGPSYTTTGQVANRPSSTPAMSGYYVVEAELGNCKSKDSALVSVFNTITPDVKLTIAPGVNICIGDMVSFTANATGGGNAPVLRWYKNNVEIPGTTNRVTWQSNSLVTGDVIYCIYTANWPCLTKQQDTSDIYTINASGNLPPTALLKVSPGSSVPSGTAITFSATHTNMGNSPEYRWIKNGVVVLSGKTPKYIAVVDQDVRTGDQIQLWMLSDLTCAEPDTALSNIITIGKNLQLEVGTIDMNEWKLYPNPNNGVFTLKGYSSAKELNIDITDAVGRVLYRTQLKPVDGQVQHQVQTTNMPAGVYMLRIHDDEGNVGNMRFSVVQ